MKSVNLLLLCVPGDLCVNSESVHSRQPRRSRSRIRLLRSCAAETAEGAERAGLPPNAENAAGAALVDADRRRA